jgi:hypothetical protein
VAPEILIVGDPDGHADLARRVRAAGYQASLCAPAAIDARMAGGRVPGAIVVCIDDRDAAALMERVRGSRLGAAVPVALYGRLGEGVVDLADVLDLGADHLLEAPATDDELLMALEQLAGPPTSQMPEVAERSWTGPSDARAGHTGSYPDERSVSGSIRGSSSPAALRGADPVIGQLHRTLDMLEERLRGPGRPTASPSREDLNLDDLGLDGVPDVDVEFGPNDSQDRMPVEQFDLPALSGGAGSGPRVLGGGAPDATVLLEETGPLTGGARARAGAGPVPSPRERRRRRALDSSYDDAPRRDRPRRTEPLPLESRGSVAVVEVPRLLWTLHRAYFGGRLTIRRGRVEKHVWFDDGRIVFARSNVGQDRLIDGLLRRGVLSRAQYDAVRRLAAKEPRRAGQLLVESGFVKPDELHLLLRAHLTRIVDSTFGWTEGTWELEVDETCDEAVTLSSSTARILADGIRDRMDAPQLMDLLGGPDQYPTFAVAPSSTGAAGLAEQLALTASEQEWIDRLDGRRSLRDLGDEPGTDALELVSVTYILHVLGHVELSGEPPPLAASARPAAEIDAERLQHRLGLARRGDYFALLGLGRDACRLDVRRAHADLSATFAPERLEPATRDDFADELAELRAVLDEARELLSDDGLRNAYLAHLDDPPSRPS